MGRAHHKQPARKPKRQRKRRMLARKTNDDFTIAEWCRKRRIARGTFYKMLKEGTAPKTLKLKKRRTIPYSADAEWQAKREREAATAAEAHNDSLNPNARCGSPARAVV